MNFSINIDTRELKKDFSKLEQQKIVKSFLNKLSSRVKTEIGRKIRGIYKIKLKDLKLKIDKATSSRLTSLITAPLKRLNLISFAKQTKRGVRVEVIRGKRETLHDAFIAQPVGRDWSRFGQTKQVTSPKNLVLEREGKNPYPLKGLTTLSSGKMVENDSVHDHVQHTINRDAQKIFNDQIKWILSKRK